MSVIKTLQSVIRLRKIELNSTKRRLNFAANIMDLRRIAKRRLPKGVFDYIDGGAEDELALRRSTEAYEKIIFRPRVLVDSSVIDTSTTLFGEILPFPFICGVTGFSRIANSAGELAVARAAERAGLIYTVGTLGTRSIEEVAAVKPGRKWFQVYVWRDRGLVQFTLERAAAAGYEALVLTADTPVFGRRNRDVRQGLTLPPKIGLSTLIDGVRHPSWTFDFFRGGAINFENVKGGSVEDGSTPVTLAEYVGAGFDRSLCWDDLEWMRSIWKGRILIKGIQCVDDALIAADCGVDAIALSNHGGRQLDSAPAIIDLVVPVVDALQGRLPVICDGGVRRGSDIIKALALGATAAMGGRAYLYGLAAGGERGVDHALGLLRDEVERTMALLGCPSLAALDRKFIAMDSVQGIT